MKRITFARLAVLMLAVAGLVLQGCGGDDGVSQSVHDQAMMDLEQAQQDLMDAEGERDQAQQDLMDAEGERDQAQQDLMDVEGERDQAQQDLMDAEGERDQAQQDLMDAEGERDQAQQDLMDTEDAADMQQAMADSAAAKALLAVLANSALNTNADGSAIAGHTAPSPMVSVSTDGMLMAKAAGYTMADMPPDMIEGWRGATVMNEAGDTAVVYSDISDDGTQTLLDRYDSTRPTGGMARSWPVGGTEVTDNPTGATYIPWSEVMRPDDMTTAGGTRDDPITMFEGAVHGIPGTFSCNADAAGFCTAPQRYSDGTVNGGTTGLPTARANAWTFVPDEGAAIYTDDTDYLTFGWWLSKGADGKPDDLTLIRTAMGLGVVRTEISTLGTTLRGSANYKGGAAGKYAMASTTADMYEGGHFTADATLMVDFDADNDAATAGNDRGGIALSGMIDNFMTGATARPGWMVKLMVGWRYRRCRCCCRHATSRQPWCSFNC